MTISSYRYVFVKISAGEDPLKDGELVWLDTFDATAQMDESISHPVVKVGVDKRLVYVTLPGSDEDLFFSELETPNGVLPNDEIVELQIRSLHRGLGLEVDPRNLNGLGQAAGSAQGQGQ